MKKILLTGKTGFIGRNIIEILQKEYEVIAPTRQELDLKSLEAVTTYLKKGKFDVILHCANPNPVKNPLDTLLDMAQDSLQMFMNFYVNSHLYGKMLYLGSGAEYDKRRDLCLINENQINESIPVDSYGFAKCMMNALALKSDNIYNMRIFACYGPYDHDSKFITHAINCSLKDEAVTIRQNCWFDYMHVEDLGKIICWAIAHDLKYHDYNICSGKRITLKEIAEKVCEQLGNVQGISILADGYNKEYTANNSRFLKEIEKFEFISIDEGIAKQIEWQRSNKG